MIQAVGPTTSPIPAVEASVARIAVRRRRIQLTASLIRCLALFLAILFPLAILAQLPWSRFVAWRTSMGVVMWGGLVLLAWAIIGPALRRRPVAQTARDIEKSFPAFEERLSTALAPVPAGPIAPSASLRAHVARQAQSCLDTLSATGLAPTHSLRSWTVILLAVGISWAAFCSIPNVRRPVAVGIYRLLRPWQSRLPDFLADLTASPGNIAILEGDPLAITANTSADDVRLIVQPDAAPRSRLLMQRLWNARWQIALADVRESFRYRVTTDREETPWFRVEVTPRPTIQSLAIHYDYPAYTEMPPRNVIGLDAAIEALAGSRVTLRIHTSEPLDLGRSRLIVGTQSQAFTALASENDYQTTLTVEHDTSFSIDLVNQRGVHSQQQSPRHITARPDQIPSIVVQSPDNEITARPDDVIPIQFLASDDFGVTRIEAILQMDGNSLPRLSIPFDHSNLKHVAAPEFPLALSDVLTSARSDGRRELQCQLRVTDNRSPNPQSALSSSRVIRIDPQQARSYQGRLDQALARSLTDIIANAIKELDLIKPRLLQSKTRDGSEPLGEWQRHELHTAAHDLPLITTRLARSAAQPTDKTFVPVTEALTEIANGPLRTAAEQSVRADLNPDDWQQRNDAITQSTGAVNTAREALQKLLDSNEIEQRRGQAEAVRDFDAAQTLQRASLDAIRRNVLPRATELQFRALRRLSQAMEESAAARNQESRRLAEQLQNIERALQELAGKSQRPDQIDQLGQQMKDLADASARAVDTLQRAATAMNLASASPGSASGGAQRQTSSPTESPAPGAPVRNSSSGPLPASIRDLGITPDQWLRLSPEAQREVLATSQQQGPISYRPLIQDYYVKVSQMKK